MRIIKLMLRAFQIYLIKIISINIIIKLKIYLIDLRISIFKILIFKISDDRNKFQLFFIKTLKFIINFKIINRFIKITILFIKIILKETLYSKRY